MNDKLSWRVKRLAYMLQRARASLALRGWRGTLARIRQEFRPTVTHDETLSLIALDEPFTPFALPASPRPRVSVVIPVHGKREYTVACLRSLARHGAEVPFETIVVDDASPDDTLDVLAGVEGLRLIANRRNLGFVDSCNAGATEARGDYLVFLNNDTQVTSGWMDALLRCFAERAQCGIAGSRLVYPDGRLQEAGALVFADGGGWNVGRFESRNATPYRYRRQTDYVSGAALMIRREVFQRVGRFDTRYAPAYFEDVDLAFAVRRLGLQVWYEPGSTVVHCEGISAGTDLDAGMKSHQRPNQAVFVEKWASELALQPPPGTALERAVRWKRRGRVLVVDATMPDPARDSGSLRLCGILHILDEQGWSVLFHPDDGRADDADVDRLGALGCEVLRGADIGSLPDWLRRHGHHLHAVMLCRHTVAGQYADAVRRHAPQARLLFDTVDLHFLREERAAALAGHSAMAGQASQSRRSELALVEKADTSLVVSPYEKELLSQLLPKANVVVLSNIHAVHGSSRRHTERRDLVFIGGAGHPPNVDALRWIASDILPRLRKALPDIRVHALGDMPDPLRRELDVPGLQLHGRVADLTPWLDTCLASIAPLRFGAGVKGKINMAMSHGVPVIATTLAVEGMQLKHDRDVLIADDADAFVDAALRLRDDAILWDRLCANGMENIRQHFSPEQAAATLQRALD